MARVRPRLEFLEDRCVPSTLTVDHNWDNSAPPGKPAPQGTLEWAAANAQNGDTIVITGAAVNHGIDLTHGEVILTQQGLTITTAAGKSPATINGDNLSRVFEVAPGASVTVDNVNIINGNAVGNNPGSPFGNGGGILVDAGATLTVNGCSFSGNFAGTSYGGGGIGNYGTLTVSASTFSNNGANTGGAISNNGMLSVSGSTLSGNNAYTGGGIFNEVGATATITGSSLSGNDGFAAGGGIDNAGTLTVSASTLSGNSTGGYFGGGILNEIGGNLTVSACTLSGNNAQYGGAIFVSNGSTATISGSTVSGNSAGEEGGGIFNSGALYVLNGSSVTGNFAPAGADLYNLGTFFISSDSTVGVIVP